MFLFESSKATGVGWTSDIEVLKTRTVALERIGHEPDKPCGAGSEFVCHGEGVRADSRSWQCSAHDGGPLKLVF